MKALGGGASRRKALRLVGIYRLLLAGPVTRAQILEALGALYGPNADRAVRRDLETLAGRPFAELATEDEAPDPDAVALHHDRATDLISLRSRDALLRLDGRLWAALDLVTRAFPPGVPHADDVQALVEQVRRMAEPAGKTRFPIDVTPSLADPTPASNDLVEKIEQALRRRQEVAFRYRARARKEHRFFDAVEPVELAFRHGHQYLTVYEPQRNRHRELRVDRIVLESWRLLPRVVGAAPRAPLTVVQYRLRPELASGGVSERVIHQSVDWEPDGSAVVTGEVRDLFWAARLILGYGSQAEALAPPELCQTVAEEVARMSKFYRSSGS